MNTLTGPHQSTFVSGSGSWYTYPFKSPVCSVDGDCSTYLVGVVVRVANHMVHPVWLRRAYGTNGCLLLDSLTSAGNRNGNNEKRKEGACLAFTLLNANSAVCSSLTVMHLISSMVVRYKEQPRHSCLKYFKGALHRFYT